MFTFTPKVIVVFLFDSSILKPARYQFPCDKHQLGTTFVKYLILIVQD